MPFFECEFPRDIAFQAQGGPGFSTQVNEGFSGFEQRNRNWKIARAKYQIALDHKPFAYFQQVYNFWLNVGGRADGFRFFDPKDNQAVDQVCALVVDSPYTGRVYQLQNTYTAGPRSYTKTIVKPITSAVETFSGGYCSGAVSVEVAGSPVSGWELDPTTGLLTLATAPGGSPPAVVTATFQFHIPVRFNTDECNAVIEESDVADGNMLVTWPDVALYETRLLSSGAGSLGA